MKRSEHINWIQANSVFVEASKRIVYIGLNLAEKHNKPQLIKIL